MKGYKVPEGWAIGWRNAFERYPKDSEYAWGMNAVLESIEAFPLEELDENPWQTGTPTEEGWYQIAIKFGNRIEYESRKCKRIIDNNGNECMRFDGCNPVVAWQKITPYEEN